MKDLEDAMIEVKNLTMSYGKRMVLDDISFQIQDGMMVGLLGANGAGKTTTMNILTGYLKPTGGEIVINGVDMRNNPKEAKRRIGYLPEHPPVYQDMKVLEYLVFVAELKGVKDKKEEAIRVMEQMNLSDRGNDFIKRLSKGMQQRVGFAQALLGNPEVLILDEPLVGLDPAEAKRTRDLIKELQGNHIVIISSHILKEIEEMCSMILMLKDGKIILNDSTKGAKRRGHSNQYRLIVKGDVNKVQDVLKAYDAIREMQYVSEKEAGVHEFRIVTKSAKDIRDIIVGHLVGKRLSVYGIEKIESSLEEVYIKMTDEEEE